MVDAQDQRRIAVFTGSRAEYGLMRHLIAGIAAEPSLSLQLIVSGSHLSANHGGTLAEIEADGHSAATLVQLSLDQKPPHSMAALSAEALNGIAQALERLKPERLILLGDRYEAFAAAAAAHLLGITVVHIHGGETTEGAVDDRLRHAITQLSTWHFTAAEPYRQRVIAMGHPPSHVFNVGPMARDGLLATPPASRVGFEQKTGFKFGAQNVLITYHPETLLPDKGLSGFKALLSALENITCNILFTYPNADEGSYKLLEQLHDFVQRHPEKSWVVPSLGQEQYLSALQLFEAMAGNSSSGVIEAPLAGIPVLNIGDRQKGRIRSSTVCDVAANTHEITNGLTTVLAAGACAAWPRKCSDSGMGPSKAIVNWLLSEV